MNFSLSVTIQVGNETLYCFQPGLFESDWKKYTNLHGEKIKRKRLAEPIVPAIEMAMVKLKESHIMVIGGHTGAAMCYDID